MADSFPPWVAKIRKDPLGADSYNRLLDRQKWAQAMLNKAHGFIIPDEEAGAHNAAEIPRDIGRINLAAGPSYTTERFGHATGATRVGLGVCALALNSDLYPTTQAMAVSVQNMSETGLLFPCVSSYVITSTSEVVLTHKTMTDYLGVDHPGSFPGTHDHHLWAAEDAHCAVAVHGPPFTTGGSVSGRRKQRGAQLSDLSYDYNAEVQFDGDVRTRFLLEHDEDGDHTTRSVARTFVHASVSAGGGDYDLISTSARNPISISRTSEGIVVLTNTTAWDLSALPFVVPDFQRLNGGAQTDIYCVCTPRSTATTTTIGIYIYKYDPLTALWDRADTDFFCTVYAGA